MWWIGILATLFVLVCVFMILVILIQKPRGGGLSGAFGGAGGSAQAAFGAKTGDVLTWFTVFCFTGFLVLAMGLTWAMKPVDQIQVQGATPVNPVNSRPVSTDTSPINSSTEPAIEPQTPTVGTSPSPPIAEPGQPSPPTPNIPEADH